MTRDDAARFALLCVLLARKRPELRPQEIVAEATEIKKMSHAHNRAEVERLNRPLLAEEERRNTKRVERIAQWCLENGIARWDCYRDPRGGVGLVVYVDGWPATSFDGGFAI